MDELSRLHALVQLLTDKTQPTQSLEDAERRVYESEIERLNLRCRALEEELLVFQSQSKQTQVVEKVIRSAASEPIRRRISFGRLNSPTSCRVLSGVGVTIGQRE